MKLPTRRDACRGAVLIVEDFEVGAGRKPEAHREASEGIDTFGIAWNRSSNRMGIHNSPCCKDGATSFI